MPPYGFLNLHKPSGMTSRQVVNVVQRLIRRTKVGHAGTLDPLAGGVLVVSLGPATRLIEYVQRMPKCYTGTFLLGRHSPTEDVEGKVTELEDPPVPTRERMIAATKQFTGEIEQRPPIFSALKVAGRRAYRMARRGEKVELKPRPVTIRQLRVVAYDYPALTLEIECGSGTYIRSLGRDLAESLGTAAVMSALVRTSIGQFPLEEAVYPSRVTRDNWTDLLLPPLRAVESLPRIELSAEEVVEIGHGRNISRPGISSETGEFAATDSAGQLVAILVSRRAGELGPVKNFPRS